MADFPVSSDDFLNVIPDPSSSLCGNFVRALLKLPVLLYKFISTIIGTDGNLTENFKALLVGLSFSPGDIKPSGTTPGTGWLSCDGSPVSRTTYAALFAAIGETFGAGDGVNTFNVPNIRDRCVLGQSGSRSIGTEVNTGADDYKHLLAANELPVHHHYIGCKQSGVVVASDTGYIFVDGGADILFNQVAAATKAAQTRDDSSDVPDAPDQVKIALPLPPSVVVAWYVKT